MAFASYNDFRAATLLMIDGDDVQSNIQPATVDLMISLGEALVHYGQQSAPTDGRLLGPVGVGAHWLGALVLVEPGTRDESRIDDHVHVHSIDQSRVNDEGIISYSVADGERSGVYLARLPLPAAGRSGAGIVQRRQGRGSSRD